jgi:hypothetical protein
VRSRRETIETPSQTDQWCLPLVDRGLTAAT